MGDLNFIMTIGPSGSGKSTYIESFNSVGYDIHSSDALREELLGDVNDQSHNAYIFTQMLNRTINSLSKGRSVVYDATNLNSRRRTNLLYRLKKEFPELKTYAMVSITTPENCIGRRALSDRPVPAEVIMRQIKSFEVPTKSEGFDEILLHFTESSEYRNQYCLNLFEKAITMNHDNPHHPNSTIYGHSLNVFTAMIENCGDNFKNNEELYRIGMYHDIGKVFTKTFDDEGIAHYFNHEKVSAYLYLLAFGDNTLPNDIILKEAFVIGNHMRHFSYKNNMEKYHEWRSRLDSETDKLLVRLTLADSMDSI